MNSEKKLTRPPFDENGYAMWEEGPILQAKKQTPRRWIVPAGLLVVAVVAVILVLVLRPKYTPEELCMHAIADAFFDTFGYEEPLAKELGLADAANMITDGRYNGELQLNYRSSDINLADSPAGKWLSDKGLPTDLGILSGFGMSADFSAWDDISFGRLRLSYGGIKLSVLEGYASQGDVYLASPKLLSKVLKVDTERFPQEWENAALWSLLSEEQQTKGKESVSNLLARANDLKGQLADAEGVFCAAFDTTGAFLDDILSCYTYEVALDEKGKELTKKFPVGSKKETCRGYIVRGDGQELGELLCRAFGLDVDSIVIGGADDGQMEAMIYLTKDAELVFLETTISVKIGKLAYAFDIEIQCSGDDDPQNNAEMRIGVSGEGLEVIVTLKKNTKVSRETVNSRISGEMVVGAQEEAESYGIVLVMEYSRMTGGLSITANTYWDEETVGAFETYGTWVWEDGGLALSLDKMIFRDTFNGEEMVLGLKVSLSPRTEVLKLPENSVDVLSVSEEEARSLWEELYSNLKWYLNLVKGWM